MPSPTTSTRRQMIAGVAIAFGSLAASSAVWGKTQEQTMKEVPSTAANRTRTALHQEIDFKASSQRIYEVLLDAKQFAAFTGAPAEIDPKAGGAFSMFGGMIVGRNVELVPNQRIVQAWRAASWSEGIYSVARFELQAHDASCRIVFDHTGIPSDEAKSLAEGWPSHYWEPLRKLLAT